MKNDFSTIDIQNALKIPRERFRQWLDMGFVKPSIPAAGPGTRASFTRTDVYRVEIFIYLITRGFKRNIAARFIEGLTSEEYFDCDYFLLRRESAAMIGFVCLKSRYWLVDLDQGTLYRADDAEKKRENAAFKPTEEWNDMFILNFKNLRELVDRKLDV